MKKFLILFSLLFVCSCSTNESVVLENQNKIVKVEKPYVNRNYTNDISTPCNTCTTSYTVRKPVEVIYENTTYTTVYEPKTYTTITHERKPYNKCENSDLCY